MKLYKSAPKKTKAQAMVEFAIVLPLLLLLLYGILEAGRLLFIYSTIVTGSRQAVRYGSATGLGLGVVVPRYQDCDGIRHAADRVDFLRSFGPEDIHIYHDDGPDPANPDVGKNEAEYCTGPTDTWAPSNNNTRLVVRIDGDYLPIVPKIIPFIERSQANGDPIKAKSARTILLSVAIVVTVPPQPWNPNTPTATATVATPTFTPSNTPTDTPTNTPIFTDTPSITPTATISPTITNTPTITLTPTITPTIVTGCGSFNTAIQAQTITLSGNTMTLTIPNTNVYPITVKDLFVVWNSDKGHNGGDNKTLILQSVGLLGAPGPFWAGSPTEPAVGPSAFLTTPVVFPANTTSTLVFTFDQSYDKFSKQEEIYLNLITPGCENNPVDKKYP
jgi:hypothetical protein